jgi:hypothetical protein
MKIIVSGPAAAFDSSHNPITDAVELEKLDGLVAGDLVCSDFLDGELDEIGLTGEAVRIVYDASKNPTLISGPSISNWWNCVSVSLTNSRCPVRNIDEELIH